ncbi:MAG TPA: hypothetical protein VFJ07_04460, partial [Streptosporangiaceae bacterium]|nr:hypothetical protein [Streptosporangiaceae bacterium]
PAPGLRKGHHKALRWTAGLLAAVLLAGGGTIAGMRLAAHSSPGTSSGATGSAGTAQQGALLNETLSDASSPGPLTTGATLTGGAGASASGAAAGAGAKAPVCARARHASRVARRAGMPRLSRRTGMGAAHCRRARRRVFAFFLLRGVDGQFTIQTKKGIKTLAYERGVITSVTAGKSITVKASDGTTWTWDLVSTTVVRDRQGKIGQSALTSGTPVWVGGPVVQGTKDARLIVVRPPQPASVSPSSTSSS